MAAPVHPTSDDLWPEADPEASEWRGWSAGRRLLTSLVMGALLAALLHGEGWLLPEEDTAAAPTAITPVQTSPA